MIENDEIEQKRQELRDERNATREQSGQASGSALTNGTSTNGTARSAIQALRRIDATVQSASRETTGSDTGELDTKRSSEKELVRERPGRRRLGSPRVSSPDTPETTRDRITTFGSIERVDGEFFRADIVNKKEERKADKIVKKLVDKLPDSSDNIPFFNGKAKTFTKKEVEEFYEPLKQAISDYGDYIDIYMQKLEPGIPSIWGNFTEKELDIVTRALLRYSQVNPSAAKFSRIMLDGQDYIGALVILVPRVVETMKFTSRRIPRKVKIRENRH